MWYIKNFFKVYDQTVNRYVQYTYYMFCGIFLIYTYYKSQTAFTYIFFKLIRCSRNGHFVEVLEWSLHTFASEDKHIGDHEAMNVYYTDIYKHCILYYQSLITYYSITRKFHSVYVCCSFLLYSRT